MFSKEIKSDDVDKFRDKAEKFYEKGKYDQALETYEKIREFIYDDTKMLTRIGDVARRAGEDAKAVDFYKEASELYIRQGFLIKAIATCKLITTIDPSQADVQSRLVELYDKEGIIAGDSKGVAAPTTKAKAPVAPPDEDDVEGGAMAPPDMGGAGDGAMGPPDTGGADAADAADGKRMFPRTPLFSDFSKEELAEVVSKVAFRTLSAGTNLFVAGDPGDSIFIVVAGELEAIGTDDTGFDSKQATFTEGDFFGEFAFFSGSKRASTVKAKGEVELLELTKMAFVEIAESRPHVTDVLFDFYKERVVDGIMAASYVFNPMSAEDRKQVLKHVTLENFDIGADVMKQGEAGETMYIIKSGSVQVWINDDAGGRKNIKELHEGEFFGEMAIASSKPRTATVTAKTPLEVIEFKRILIKAMVDRYPEIKNALIGMIKERIDGSGGEPKT